MTEIVPLAPTLSFIERYSMGPFPNQTNGRNVPECSTMDCNIFFCLISLENQLWNHTEKAEDYGCGIF